MAAKMSGIKKLRLSTQLSMSIIDSEVDWRMAILVRSLFASQMGEHCDFLIYHKWVYSNSIPKVKFWLMSSWTSEDYRFSLTSMSTKPSKFVTSLRRNLPMARKNCCFSRWTLNPHCRKADTLSTSSCKDCGALLLRNSHMLSFWVLCRVRALGGAKERTPHLFAAKNPTNKFSAESISAVCDTRGEGCVLSFDLMLMHISCRWHHSSQQRKMHEGLTEFTVSALWKFEHSFTRRGGESYLISYHEFEAQPLKIVSWTNWL